MGRKREELGRIIIGGEVVIHGNNVIHKPQDLPSEVVLAGSDIVQRQHAIGNVKEQLEAKRREMEELESQLALNDDEIAAQAEEAKQRKAKEEEAEVEVEPKPRTANVGVRKATGTSGVKAVKSDGGSGHKTAAPT